VIKSWISALIHSNILIALCAVALALETQVQLGLRPHVHPYLFLIFFATLFEYNLHRLITVVYVPEALEDEKYEWLRQHKPGFYLMVFLSVTGFVITLFQAKKEVLIALAPLAALALFYSTPVRHLGKKWFRLREIPYLKIFLIAGVWSGVTILLPVIHSGRSYQVPFLAALLVERIFFILAITLPFDIRDLEADRKVGLKTIPMLFKKTNPLVLSYLCLAMFAAIALVQYPGMGMSYITVALLISALTTAFFLASEKLQVLPFYHLGILDGTLLLQSVLVLVFYFLFKS